MMYKQQGSRQQITDVTLVAKIKVKYTSNLSQGS